MEWVEFSVRTDRETVDAVADVFQRFGRGGIAIEEVAVEERSPEPSAYVDRLLLVKTYLPVDDALAEKREQLAQALRYLSLIRPLPPLSERHLVETDWAEAWKEHFHVHRPGARTVVVPTWREYAPEEGETVILLDPGMAFGTGLHQTTRLCIRLIEERMAPGLAVLDLGTGSGILAILAAKLGAGRVLALDTDSVAVRVARENVALNGVEGAVQVEKGSLPLAAHDPLGLERSVWASGTFDLVVANIIAEVIAELAPSIVGVLQPGGVALCSGILGERLPQVVEAMLGSGARLLDTVSEGDWRALVVQAWPSPRRSSHDAGGSERGP